MRLPTTDKLRPASKARPCPVCGGDHKCSTSADGLILCGRTQGPVPGFAHLGPAKDPTWHLYREEETLPARSASEGRRLPSLALRAGHDTPADFRRLADAYARHLTPELEAELASKLRLPVAAMALVPGLGWNPDQGCWTVPERDPDGRVVGISTRFRDGTKRTVFGSARGLVLPAGWADRPGPLFVVEGMSDATALSHVGLAAVGRPSDKGGADDLAALLARLDPARLVVVLGENDRKPDGTWPGKDGADYIADRLRAARPGRRVAVGMPPDAYKDAREWVTDRLSDCGTDDPDFPLTVGKDIADAVARVAAHGAEPRRPLGACPVFPVPLPITEMPDGPVSVPWVWDGFLARDAITLLAAQPKAGKTTLLAHLLRALDAGGEFLGRPIRPGRTVVVSEEPKWVWADRRNKLGLSAAVRVVCRPFAGKPSPDTWAGFLTFLADLLAADPADVLVFDTLADLWPVRDENSATEVQAALSAVRAVLDGRAVVLVHHLRKNDGGEGTGARGSGALGGFVDVLLELRRQDKAADPAGCRRVITGYGRMDDIPKEWVIELSADRLTYRHLGASKAAAATAAREEAEDGRHCELRRAILAVLPTGGEGMTRADIWAALPAEVRRNEVRFKGVLESECGTLWRKEGTGGRGDPYRYWRAESWMAKGE